MTEAAVAAPPQLSPDGQWWWTGAEWVPAHSVNDSTADGAASTLGAMSTTPAYAEPEHAYAEQAYTPEGYGEQGYGEAAQTFAEHSFAEQAYEPAADAIEPAESVQPTYVDPSYAAPVDMHEPEHEVAPVAWVPAQAEAPVWSEHVVDPAAPVYSEHVVDPAALGATLPAPQDFAGHQAAADAAAYVPEQAAAEQWPAPEPEPYVPPRATMDILANGGARRASSGGGPKPLLIVGGVVLVAALAGGGYYLTQGGSSSDSAAPIATPAHHVAAANPSAAAAKVPAAVTPPKATAPKAVAPVVPAAPAALSGAAADSGTKSDIKNLATQMETYFTDKGAYTSNLASLMAVTKTSSALTTGNQLVLRTVAGGYSIRLKSPSGTPFCFDSTKAGAGVSACPAG